MKNCFSFLMSALCVAFFSFSGTSELFAQQQLPVLWEELSSPQFTRAVELSQGVCIIPMGVLEKHGTHMPLGTDALLAREVAVRAAKNQYAIVFPFYYFGQIFEARHQQGTVAYSSELLYKVLDETCHELSRNGIRKIILYNFHGGSTNFLEYFCQSQLAYDKDYVVYLAQHKTAPEVQKQVKALLVNSEGGHADETEAAMLMVSRPELVNPERAKDESGEALNRLPLPCLFTGIWWFADYPNHYSGDASGAAPELGRVLMDNRVAVLEQMIQTVKTDTTALALQREFYQRTHSFE